MHAVTHDRAAERTADTRLLEWRLGGGEWIFGIQVAIASEIKSTAITIVAAGLGDDGDHRAQRLSVLRVELVTEYFELLNCVLRHVDGRAAPDRIVDVAAVDDGRVAVARVGAAAKFCGGESAARRRRAWKQLRQHQEVATQHWQRPQLVGLDRGRGCGARDFDQWVLADDSQRLVDAGHAEPEVDRHVGADRERDFPLLAAESLELNADFIERRLERDCPVIALVAGGEHLAPSVRLVGDGDDGAGEGSAGVVADNAANVGAGNLR